MKKLFMTAAIASLAIVAGCSGEKPAEPTTTPAAETTTAPTHSVTHTPSASPSATASASTPSAGDGDQSAPLPEGAVVNETSLEKLPEKIGKGTKLQSSGPSVQYKMDDGSIFGVDYLQTSSKPDGFVKADVKQVGPATCGFANKTGVSPMCVFPAKDGLLLIHGEDAPTLDDTIAWSNAVARRLGAK